jgi:antitoxin component of MazEF toxin-antitoxin module
LNEIGIAAGDAVDLGLQDGRITVTPTKRRPREGWAEAAAEIGLDPLSDEDCAWLEAGNEGDAELKW